MRKKTDTVVPVFSFLFALPSIRHARQRIRAGISTSEPSASSSLLKKLCQQLETFDGIQSRCKH